MFWDDLNWYYKKKKKSSHTREAGPKFRSNEILAERWEEPDHTTEADQSAETGLFGRKSLL